MSDRYILDESNNAVPCEDLKVWARWCQKRDVRRVARTEIGPFTVRTVFLGIDHNFSRGGPPLLFETLVFGQTEEDMARCSTWAEAEAQHAEVVARYEAKLSGGLPTTQQATGIGHDREEAAHGRIPHPRPLVRRCDGHGRH